MARRLFQSSAAPDGVRTDLLHWAFREMRAYRRPLGMLAALSLAEVALRALMPWPMKAVVDSALSDGSAPAWIGWLPVPIGGREGLLVLAVLAGIVIQLAHQGVLMLHSRRYTRTAHLMTRDLRQHLFYHLQGLSLRHHSRTPVGDSVYRLGSDTACLEKLLLAAIMPLVFSALTLVVMFSVLMAVNLSLALVSLAVVPLLFLWIRRSTVLLAPSAERTRVLESEMTERLQESFSSIRLVKSFGREEFEGERFSGAASQAMEARVRLGARQALFSAGVGTLTITGTSLVTLAGGVLVLRGQLSVGDLLVALAYLGFVYGPLSTIANASGAIHESLASAARVHDVLRLTPEINERSGSLAFTGVRQRIEFRHVSFAYEGRSVLHDVSFAASRGEMIAIVGPSGSGKTTLASLLPRFYEADEGQVLIDGTDVRMFDLATLRRGIGIVLQEAVVVSGSVRKNLEYGSLGATPEDVERAARLAHAHEFIQRLPRGYDTELAFAAPGISGGQRQRLSMARAFLKNAPILILDEPTAALDAVSEEQVMGALRRLQAGRTTFVIAHRLSTVCHADRILVLDGGRLIAQGRHEELLQTCRLYKKLAAQFTAEKELAIGA